jgi:alkanesulfonate monooxygenase SsuD/methylene tetrahydromethanopterin reductase-like flavin-dependent oxidoreductase (luciferase family)
MHCGVMVTGYNQGDWERLLAEDYGRPPTVPDATQFDATLALGELVEPLGFDSIWATEHYGSAYSMQPNPLQYLAYWAGRTSRVDVGTAVVVVPWWNPVRLASELSMLDILLKGRRLHLGLGRGVAPHEYASLGVPQDRSHDYFYEIVDILRAADGSERFSYDGEVFRVPPTTIRPQARHKGELTINIKVAGSSATSSRLAAEHGLGQMFVADDNLEQMAAKISRFNGIRAELGLPPDQPTTLLWMYCAETEEEAEEGWQFYANQMRAVQHHYFEWNNPGFEGVKGMEHYLKMQSADVAVGDGIVDSHRSTQPIGTPEQVIECIRRVQWGISLEKLIVHFFYGGMPPEKAEKSLRLFAEQVLPAVHAMDTPINPATLGVTTDA